ncbi:MULTISPECIES: serine/threonine-protein kinase [Cyanophyceae]|uniref:serine/threonine-protein kinase n=1 Tax=Cyanophyceae TaxID=3028117 RepID=UPI00168256CF|nr:serine/threonine-protein kinase [Trichocoleus sp. FACHB-69]MBD1930534.1 serine/threonine protein kinase [Trichocoleus sp. FACHB-69]
MNFPPTNLSTFHSDVLAQTELGQLCGSEQRFRDRYEILRMLGRGGFGVTFLARDATLPGQPLCVIKQLCPKFSDPAGLKTAQKRFEQEAKTLSKLGSHSQVPMLLDYFVEEGEFYLVQEYIRGHTLARLVRRGGSITEEGVKQFLRQILPLLQYIHRNNVIHRDIKPQNIIRCQDDGRLVLIDFGAVKEEISQLGQSGVKGSTTQFIGTVGFAPPEQFSLRPVYASDIYALGVTCLYLLTGKAPLEFESDRATGEIQWQNTVVVSQEFARILNKMLKISLKERFQSAGAIMLAFGWESQDNLSQFMTTVRRPDKSPVENQPEASPSDYIPPTARTAIALRDWKARLQAKQRHQRRSDRGILSSSGNSR